MVRQFLLFFLGAAAVCLVPWIVYLANTLPDQFDTGQWRAAWVGFDVALLGCFASAAWLGVRRRRAAVPLLAAMAALLLCDAWFDVVLDWTSPDRWTKGDGNFTITNDWHERGYDNTLNELTAHSNGSAEGHYQLAGSTATYDPVSSVGNWTFAVNGEVRQQSSVIFSRGEETFTCTPDSLDIASGNDYKASYRRNQDWRNLFESRSG